MNSSLKRSFEVYRLKEKRSLLRSIRSLGPVSRKEQPFSVVMVTRIEVGPTASIPSTQNESWPLWRAEWRFTNSLHAACRTFFSWFPFPGFSFPHSDLYLHVLLDSLHRSNLCNIQICTHLLILSCTFLGVCTHPSTPAHVYPALTHAHTFPRPVDSSAILLLLFLSKIPSREKKIALDCMDKITRNFFFFLAYFYFFLEKEGSYHK